MVWTTNPGLSVTLAGQPLATTLPADRVAVDELAVTWGTDDPLEQADPATGRMSLLDFTTTWSASASLIGQPVTCGWTADANLADETTAVNARTFFRGRVTKVDVHPPDYVILPGGTRTRAARVDLTLTSVETDPANRFAADGPWPTEAISARAARIAALAGVPVTVRDYWAQWPAAQAPVDALQDTSARELLVQLYTSCGGDRMVYDPHAHAYTWLGRRVRDYRSLARLENTGGFRDPRDQLGVFARPAFSATTTADTGTTGRVWLDGNQLDAVDNLSKSAGQRITRARVTGNDGAPYQAVKYTGVKVDPNADEGLLGQRAITHDSLLRYAVDVDICAADLLAMATQEGAQWRPPPLRWDTRRTGGFGTRDQVEVLLRGHVTGHPVFLSSSWFAELGIRPVFAVTGGTIHYADGGWVLDMHLAGFATFGGGNSSPTPVKQHAVTWEEFDGTDQLVWADTPGPLTAHDSLTYEDLQFVGAGYGTTWIGPDTGWDTYQ